eukprot:TRINITY_DN27572_c0_g1_i3.p2 TRINITY_DN27572_c0_g1~~TRINITY_DN27572_c0_g1_i3.p2  ORF type:complete len:298 (+),score=77.45 TRINITY_DN27572_c0_g1_i3:72-896(+)
MVSVSKGAAVALWVCGAVLLCLGLVLCVLAALRLQGRLPPPGPEQPGEQAAPPSPPAAGNRGISLAPSSAAPTPPPPQPQPSPPQPQPHPPSLPSPNTSPPKCAVKQPLPPPGGGASAAEHSAPPASPQRVAELEDRIAQLECAVAALQHGSPSPKRPCQSRVHYAGSRPATSTPGHPAGDLSAPPLGAPWFPPEAGGAPGPSPAALASSPQAAASWRRLQQQQLDAAAWRGRSAADSPAADFATVCVLPLAQTWSDGDVLHAAAELPLRPAES